LSNYLQQSVKTASAWQGKEISDVKELSVRYKMSSLEHYIDYGMQAGITITGVSEDATDILA
jgi:hypothetical protein